MKSNSDVKSTSSGLSSEVEWHLQQFVPSTVIINIEFLVLRLCLVGKVCIHVRAKWPIRPELIPVSLA